MSKTLPSADGCKGAFSPSSHANGLAFASSHGTSSHHLSGLINSWPKALLAFGFFALTNFVIFEDVLRHGATVTTDHLLSFAVLVGTFAAGHFFWPTWRAREYGTAAGLTMLFAAGTVYCVLTSAGRNAEALTTKAAKVAADDGPRLALAKQVEEADGNRKKAEAELEAAKAETKDATAKADQVCRENGSKSWKCRTERTNADAAKGREAPHETTSQDKTNTYYMLDARLRGMTKRETNVDLKYAAKILNYLPRVYVTEEQLADIIPFVKGVFCEFATLLFAAGAFRHRRTHNGTVPPTTATVPQLSAPATVPPNRPTLVFSHRATVAPAAGTVPQGKDAALGLLRQHLVIHGTVQQEELKELFGVKSKSTVSRWCDEWETTEVITREIVGRTKIVRLSVRPATRSDWPLPNLLRTHVRSGMR